MKRNIKVGSTDVTLYLFIQDSSVSTGAGLTGLAFNTSGLTCYYVRPLVAASAITLATQTATGAHTDGGFVEVDATNMPGWYRLDLPDAVCAAGKTMAGIQLKGASNMAPCNIELQLVAYNPDDAVRLGLTALPNAAADAAGGLPVSDAGGLDLDARLDVAVSSRLAPTTAGRTLDVTTGGAAGIDWANVENLATSNTFANTTIGTATNLTNAGPDSSGVTTLLSRLSAARAGYLDNLSGGAVALADKLKGYVQLLARKDSAIGTDRSAELNEINANEGTGAGGYDQTSDSQQGIRDDGDSNWSTATPPSAATIATQVWGHGTRTLTANTNFNDPTAAAIASQVRTELTTELGRIDADITTRATPAQILTTQLTESYAANGVAPTLSQGLFAIHQMLMQFGISGTNYTVRQLDDSTTAFVVTLDDGTAPTDASRV